MMAAFSQFPEATQAFIDLLSGSVRAGQLVYDGTKFVLVGSAAVALGDTGLTLLDRRTDQFAKDHLPPPPAPSPPPRINIKQHQKALDENRDGALEFNKLDAEAAQLEDLGFLPAPSTASTETKDYDGLPGAIVSGSHDDTAEQLDATLQAAKFQSEYSSKYLLGERRDDVGTSRQQPVQRTYYPGTNLPGPTLFLPPPSYEVERRHIDETIRVPTDLHHTDAQPEKDDHGVSMPTCVHLIEDVTTFTPIVPDAFKPPVLHPHHGLSVIPGSTITTDGPDHGDEPPMEPNWDICRLAALI